MDEKEKEREREEKRSRSRIQNVSKSSSANMLALRQKSHGWQFSTECWKFDFRDEHEIWKEKKNVQQKKNGTKLNPLLSFP